MELARPGTSVGWAVVAVLLAAWALVPALLDGGYFPVEGGLAALPLVLAVAVAVIRWGPVVLADRAVVTIALPLALLALLAAISISWAWFAPHRAWIEAGRYLSAAAAVACGATWLVGAPRRRLLAASIGVVPTAVALATCAWLATAPSEATGVLSFGKVAWPIGNSNAQAVWLVVGTWCLLGSAAAVASPSRRAAATVGSCAATTATWTLVLAAESAGALMATGAAAALLAATTAGRRVVAWNATCAAVAWGVAGGAVDQLHAIGASTITRQAAATGPVDATRLADAAAAVGRMGLAAAVAAAALATVVQVARMRIPRPHLPRPGRRLVAAVLVGAMLVGVIAVATTTTGHGIARSAFTCPVPPPPDADGFRARTDVEYDFRCDYWRVAIDSMAQRPVAGWGAGSFHGRYVLDRRGPEQPRQPHSLPLRAAGDLGVPGLVAFIAFAAGMVASWMRLRGRVDGVVAASIGATGTLFAHAMLDFTFDVLAITLPVLLLAGAVAGSRTTLEVSQPRHGRVSARLLVASLLVLAWSLLVLPQVMATGLLRAADDPGRDARSSLEVAGRASAWDPTWARPHLTRAFALLELERPREASDAARSAERLEPNHWTVRVAAARIHAAAGRTGRANRASTAAHQLNPQLDTGA